MVAIARRPTPAVLGMALVLGTMLAPGAREAQADPLGAEFGYTLGTASGPFRTDFAIYFNGFLDLPITKSDPLFGQKFVAEIMVGHSRSQGTFDPVVVNGETVTDFEITTFQVFIGGKYKFDKLGAPESLPRRIQPYVLAGPLLNLFLCRTNQDHGTQSACGAGPLYPELRGKGVPVGGGDVRFDYSLGGGVDVQVASQFMIGLAARHSFSSPNARYTMVGATAAFLF